MSKKVHEKILRDEIFFTKNKWPHFDILFNGIKKIAKLTKKNQKVVMLERTNLYGGVSLFAPFFKKKNFTSVDCITENLLKRGWYNKKFLTNNKLIKIKSKYQFHYKNLKLKNSSADYVIIPNLLHHIDDPITLFKQVKKILKPKGSIFIFEPLVRELHQIPEDYSRFTPYGLNNTLKKLNFKNGSVAFSGGPFTCILYYLDQAIQFIPLNKRKNFLKKFNFDQRFLIQMDKVFKKNLIRKNSSAPVSFSIMSQLKK
jgi:SAM-dependent methyltransferase